MDNESSYFKDDAEDFGDDMDGDGKGKRREPWESIDPEEHFFWGQHDICNIAAHLRIAPLI